MYFTNPYPPYYEHIEEQESYLGILNIIEARYMQIEFFRRHKNGHTISKLEDYINTLQVAYGSLDPRITETRRLICDIQRLSNAVNELNEEDFLYNTINIPVKSLEHLEMLLGNIKFQDFKNIWNAINKIENHLLYEYNSIAAKILKIENHPGNIIPYYNGWITDIEYSKVTGENSARCKVVQVKTVEGLLFYTDINTHYVRAESNTELSRILFPEFHI